MTPPVDLLGSVGFALGAGVATFFSPCAYPLLPGYVGFYASRAGGADGEAPVGGALLRALAASAGVLVVFGGLLAVLAVVGHAAVARLTVLEPVVGLALVLLGVATVADRVPDLSVALPRRRTSVLGFAGFGAGYAVAAAGCVLPIFAGVLVQALALPAVEGVAVVGAYALGMAGLMAAVTVVSALGVDVGTDVVGHVDGVVRLAGGLMVLAGLAQLYLSLVELGVGGFK